VKSESLFRQCEKIRAERTKEYGSGVEEVKRVLSSFNSMCGTNLEAHHFALMMSLIKWVRHDTTKKEDNWIDWANYLAIAKEIEDAKD